MSEAIILQVDGQSGDNNTRPNRPLLRIVEKPSYEVEEIDIVIGNARAIGYITRVELAAAIDEAGYEKQQILELLEMLEELEIEIIESPSLTPPEAIISYDEGETETGPAGGSLKTFLDQASRLPRLTAKQEQALGRGIQKGDVEAKKTMIASNILLIIRHAAARRKLGLDMDDLVMEGVVGVGRGAEKFDPEMGYKFSTYVTWWIRQALDRAIEEKGRAIRLPQDAARNRQSLLAVQAQLEQKLKRTPTFEEILGESTLGRNEAETAWFPPEATTSLSRPIGEDKDDELIEIIENTGVVPIIDEVAQSEQSRALVEAMQHLLGNGELVEQEVQMLVLRYGLFGVQEHNVEEICRLLRINQKQYGTAHAKTLKKLARIPELHEKTRNPEEFESNIRDDDEVRTIDWNDKKIKLIERHCEIVKRAAGGMKVKQIGKELSMKETTTKAALLSICNKLGHRTREDAMPDIINLAAVLEA